MAETHVRTVAEEPGTPLRWVEGRCLSYGTSVAYQLWLDLLRSLMGLRLERERQHHSRGLRRWLGSNCGDQAQDVFPYLGRLLLARHESRGAGATAGLLGDQLKEGTFHAIESCIPCAAHQAPLVIVCEDLQWADPSSSDVLERMLAGADRTRVLFICVARPDPGHKILAHPRHRCPYASGHHTDLCLEPLTARKQPSPAGQSAPGRALALRPQEAHLRPGRRQPFLRGGDHPLAD